jgi:CRP-like cAMP-binding protein/phosphoribosyl 1,2-cyclic phosphodiesterase
MVEITEINLSDTLIALPRGGYLVQTPAGYVQFGSPPETIKDTMKLPGGVPEIFVLPEKMFNWIKGISIAEIEFPLYWNYFIRKKKTLIICREEQFEKMKKVFKESVFGPETFNIADDYSSSIDHSLVPDILAEMTYFRNSNKLSNMVQFGIFKDNRFSHNGITISIEEDGDYKLSFKNNYLAKIPGNIEYKSTYLIGERLPEPYLPPLFGVTCLGPSHGFDPEENTSGFIIWLNHQGIMVDPPVNSTEWLEDSNVSPKFIDSIILTHCHADHDAGTFQKILEEGKVTVYSTETVMKSFLHKYSALSDVSPEYLMSLFDFYPVKIGNPLYINGGKFEMFYTLHSIPTIGFRMEFQNQSFVYSSDHNNDPKLHDELFEKKVINKIRYDELKNFPWDSKVIYHESGVPPLHTPISYMNTLPVDIQKRIVIYHIAKKDFPEETSLTLAKFGMENTLYFETEAPLHEDAYQILSVFKRLDFMSDLPVWKAQELLDIVVMKKFRKGDKIIEKGTIGNEFFIIYAGNISVDSEGLERDKIYGPYDYFGEVALITGQKRAADIYAQTDVILFTIEKDKFLNFIVGTEFEKILKKVAATRSIETWNLLSMNDFFKLCTPTQKTWLESIFIPQRVDKPETLIREGDTLHTLYLIRDGEIEVCRNNKKLTVLGKGDFVGSLERLHKNLPAVYTFRNRTPVSLFAMRDTDLKFFIDKNPGLLMKFTYEISVK